MRRVVRMLLLAMMAGSLALSAITLRDIATTPLLRPLADRSAAQIVAATDRLLARAGTPDRITARLDTLIAAPDRNWIAIAAVEAVALERAVPLTPDYAARRAAAWQQDNGWRATAASCARCAWDAASCDLSAALICQAPMVLTPLGDIAGLTTEAARHAAGQDVDAVNLTLSMAGLAATGLVVASGGSSATVKLGAGAARLAWRMKLLTPPVAALLRNAARNGVDWARLPAARSGDDLAALLRPDVMAPVSSLLADAGRIGGVLRPLETLHLLRFIDGPTDAARLARASEALGARTVGRLEVLGKARFLRATLRLSDVALALAAGFVGLIASTAALAGSFAASRTTRLLRRAVR